MAPFAACRSKRSHSYRVSRGKLNETVREYAQPASAFMIGTPQTDGLTFTVDQTVSPASNGWAITGVSLVDVEQG
jgi:hypothetical protein